MAYATDRDLLVLEPRVFQDAGFVGQKVAQGGDAQLTGTSLISASANFESAGVDAGHVVLVETIPAEVVERLGPTELTVSRLRPHEDDAPIPPPSGSGLKYDVFTFGPQIAAVHKRVARMMGIEPDDPDSASLLESVVNVAALARVEALGALEVIFGAASAAADDVLAIKARLYRDRFDRARWATVALLDLDGNGVAEVRRPLNATQWVRG